MQVPPSIVVPPSSGIYYPSPRQPPTFLPAFPARRPNHPSDPYRQLAIPSEGRNENQARAESQAHPPTTPITIPGQTHQRHRRQSAGSSRTTLRTEDPPRPPRPPPLPPKPQPYIATSAPTPTIPSDTPRATQPVPRPSHPVPSAPAQIHSSTTPPAQDPSKMSGRGYVPHPTNFSSRSVRVPDWRRGIDPIAPGGLLHGGRADSPMPDTEIYENTYRPNARREEREYYKQRVFADSRRPHFGNLGSRSRTGEVDPRRSSSPPAGEEEVVVRRRRIPRVGEDDEDRGESTTLRGEVQRSTPPSGPSTFSDRARAQLNPQPARPSNTSRPNAPTSSSTSASPPAGQTAQGRGQNHHQTNQAPTRQRSAGPNPQSSNPPQPAERPFATRVTPPKEHASALRNALKAITPAPASSQAPASALSRDTHFEDGLEEEMTCPICMSIMVGPHQVTPCGHALCGGCGVQWIQTRASTGDRINCPTCREAVDRTNPLTPARTLENLIRKWIDNKIATEGEWEGSVDFREREECWRIHKEHSPEGIIPPSLLRSVPGFTVVERTPSGSRMPRAEFPVPHVSDMVAHMDSVFDLFYRPNFLPVLDDPVAEGRERGRDAWSHRGMPDDLAFRINHFLDEHPGLMDYRFHFELGPPPAVRPEHSHRHTTTPPISSGRHGRRLPRPELEPPMSDYLREFFEGVTGGEREERNPMTRRR
ncbi:hypothetical protein I302_100611 [Kwoniella bestiolae CBS 10118]|uniref:RING-type domain-containing protein n=1 Tax=Kwoniella bestiolae CBS 10118 TaxID=1296100 RepID=A0A1B9G5M6_9TREE|nr:hypothetical protein I302_03985 [Kwoniella bestiolae CBS 10118]OCF26302.1 hypothetical protein I302_03985 [Kwoniella bestiolae CBS 10118]